MATEQYSNLAQDSLSAGISNADVTLTLTDGSEFPSSGSFRIVIGTEIIIVGARSSNTLSSLTRGAESTTAASHSSGATVTQVLTRDGLQALGTVLHPSDTFANLDAVTLREGVVGFPSDGLTVLRHGAAAKATWGPLSPLTRPVDADFAWINQGGATVTDAGGGIHLHGPGGGPGGNARIRKQTAPATPYVITALMSPCLFFKDFHTYGLVFRQSSDGKLVTFDHTANGTLRQLRVTQWTNATTATAAVQPISLFTGFFPWMRIADNGTNRIYSVSADGQNWTQFYSEARTTHITADEVGFHVVAENSAVPNLDAAVTLLSWKVT